MFSTVVYRISNHKYKVESTNTLGDKNKIAYYKHLNDIPDDIGIKVKQLMWTNEDDQTITNDLGVRVGKNIFWII